MVSLLDSRLFCPCSRVVLRRTIVVGADIHLRRRQPEYASTRQQAPAGMRRLVPTPRTAPTMMAEAISGDTASAIVIDRYQRLPHPHGQPQPPPSPWKPPYPPWK